MPWQIAGALPTKKTRGDNNLEETRIKELKKQIDEAISKNQNYFTTMAEFIYNTMIGGSELPFDNPHFNLHPFLIDNTLFQLNRLFSQVEEAFNRIENSKGVETCE